MNNDLLFEFSSQSWAQRALLLILILLAVGCGEQHTRHGTSQSFMHTFDGNYPIKVVCTTGPIAEMVIRIGGNLVRVESLMGPGVDPHLYRPVASDVRKLNEADVIFFNGLHLEGRMADLFVRLARQKATYAVTEGIVERQDLRLREPPEFQGMYDPHVWHDVALWSDCVQDVARMLGELDSSNAETYSQNAEVYRQELVDLDEYCRREIASIPQDRRVLVTAHDAFGYFGAAYDLEVHGLKGMSTEDEIDLNHQAWLQKLIVERRVPAVFVESAVAPRTVQALVEPSRAAGHDLRIPEAELYADALGPSGTEQSSYTGMIRHNVRTIVDALSAD